MAIAIVGSITHINRTQWDSSVPLTIQSTTAGSLLVLIAAWFAPAANIMTGITGAGTWVGSTLRQGDANSSIQIWHAPNVSGSITTLTVATDVTATDISAAEVDVIELSGMATSSANDVDVTGTGTDATMETVSGTLAQAEEIIFNIGSHTGADATLTHDVVGSYTLISQNNDNDDGQTYLSQYKIVAATTTDTADIGLTAANRAWFTSGVSFKGAGGAAAAPVRVRRSMLMGVG